MEAKASEVLREDPAPRTGTRRKSALREYGESIAIVVAAVLLLRVFVVQASRIPSESMEDTLLTGDFLLVDRMVYGAHVPFTDWRFPAIREPRRGDVIVFEFPRDRSRDFIKRVIGLPGETVEIRDKRVYVDGTPIEEPYVKLGSVSRNPDYLNPKIRPEGAGNRDFYGPVVVPEGSYFVMGDNRDRSEDSRYWGFLDRELVKGRALVIYMSLDGKTPRVSRIGDVIR